MEEDLKFLDEFLNKGVPNDLITWSKKANERNRSNSKKKKGKLLSKDTIKKDKKAVNDSIEKPSAGENCCKDKYIEEEEGLLSGLPKFTLFKKEDRDIINEMHMGKERKVNLCIRRLVARAAKLDEK